MERPSATATERANYVRALIEEERPHSLLRIMRRRSLVIYKVVPNTTYYSSLGGLGGIDDEMTKRTATQDVLWSETDSLERLIWLPPFKRLNVWVSDKEAKRIIKMLKLIWWPEHFDTYNHSGLV